MLLDLILEAFGAPLATFWWFWRVLETGWNFIEFQDPPWGPENERTRPFYGLRYVPGSVNSNYCQSANS